MPDAGYAVSAGSEVIVRAAKDSLAPMPVAVDWFKHFFRRPATPPRQETLADRLAHVSQLQINPRRFVGYVGQTIALSAMPLDAGGQTIEGVRFDWASSDQDKAQVDEAGNARLLHPGLVRIICHAGSIQASVPLLVRPGNRPPQSDAEWRADQDALKPDGTVTGQVNSGGAGIVASLFDYLLPTAEAQNGGSSDLIYDELWSEPRNLTGTPRNRATESTRIGPVMPEGSNFRFAAPVYSLGGRGIATSLTLYYNSRVWSRRGNNMAYDAVTGWPAPGFSLGFGRVIAYNVQGSGLSAICKYLLVDPDGTRHYLGAGYYSQTGSYQTNDGSHIRFTGSGNNGGTLSFIDGTTVNITPVNNRLLPTQVLDLNGNYIQIAHKDSTQGYNELAIDYVTDTLGRLIQFNYDASYRLTSVTVPGFGGTAQNPVTQTAVQFDYQPVTTGGTFSGLTIERGTGGSITALKRVYYPATGTGFMPTYTVYGVISSISTRRQMSGPTSDGVESNSVSFNYPTSGPLSDAPAFTQRTEAAANAPTATYVYSTSIDSAGQTKTFLITRPDSSVFWLTRDTNAAHASNGLLVQSGIYNATASAMTYTTDGSGSPQVQSIIVYDDTGVPAKVDLDYDSSGNVTNTREYGYQVNGQWLVRRRTRNVYTTISGAANLLTETDVYDAQLDTNDGNDTLITKSTFTYDNYAAMSGMEDYNGTAAPPGHYSWYGTGLTARGNVTGRTVWYDIAGNLSYTWLRKVDIFGNVVKEQLSCCNEQTATNTDENFWQTPTAVTKGAAGGPQLTTTSHYDFNTGRAVSSLSPAGLTSTPSYDTAGRLTSVSVSDGNGHTLPGSALSYGDSSLTINNSLTYDDNGTNKTLTSTATLDGWGRTIQTVNPAQSQVNTTYDAMGRVASVTKPFAAGGTPTYSTTTTYDVMGRATVVTQPDGQTVRTTYAGNTVTITNQVNRKLQRITDGLGRLVTIYEQDSSGSLTQATTYTYDLLNNLTQVNQGNQLRAFKYDAMSRLLYERIPEQTATLNDGTGTYWTTHYTYTDFNTVATRTDARGVLTSYFYDSLHRLQQVVYDTGSAPGVAATDAVVISYNADGTVDGTSAYTNYSDSYDYDWAGRPVSVTKVIGGKSYTFTTTYNGASQPLTLIYPSGTEIDYSYDAYGRQSGMTGSSANTNSSLGSINYNVAGQVSSDVLGNGVTEQFNYDPARSQLISQKAGTSSPFTDRLDLTYGYTASSSGQFGIGTIAGNAGQLLSVAGTLNGATESASFTYDNYGRLATSNQTSNGSSAQRRFQYDRWGNRVAVWNATSGGSQIQSLALVTSGGIPTNRLSSVTSSGSSVNYVYDSAGNVTGDGQHTYIYDAENRLVSVDSGAAQYRYDPSNQRVSKLVGSSLTHYLWQGGKCVAEHDGTTPNGGPGDPPYGLRSAQVDYLYRGGRLVASAQWAHTTTCPKGVCTTSHTATAQYYLSDRLSVRLVLDASGNVAGRQGHLPFGEDFAESGTQQKQHFTTYQRDAETGIDYAMHRLYNQGVGRFNRVDPLSSSARLEAPQRWNRYTYALNEPLDQTDSMGLDLDEVGPCDTENTPGYCAPWYQSCNCEGEMGSGFSGGVTGGGGGDGDGGFFPPDPAPVRHPAKKCSINVKMIAGQAISGSYPITGRYGALSAVGPVENPVPDGFWGFTFEIDVVLPSDDRDPADWQAIQWVVKIALVQIMFKGKLIGVDKSEGGTGPYGTHPDNPFEVWIDRTKRGHLYWADTPDIRKVVDDPRGESQPIESGGIFWGFVFQAHNLKDSRKDCQATGSLGLQIKDRKAIW